MALDAQERAWAAMLAKYESLTDEQRGRFREMAAIKQPVACAVCEAHDGGMEWPEEFMNEVDRMRSALKAKKKKK